MQHGPITLRGTEFITGLGMHSRMAVTYQLRGIEREFQATVGIDDIAQGAGSVVFAVELDGRRIWTSSEITGKSPLTSVGKIDLHGGKQLTLLVGLCRLVRCCADTRCCPLSNVMNLFRLGFRCGRFPD